MQQKTPSKRTVVPLYRRWRRAAAPDVKKYLLRTGVLRAIRGIRRRPQLAVLRYHAICGPAGHAYASPAICVSPAAFERQVAYLKRHYSVMSLPDAVRDVREGRALPSDAVALTFDDGYADNLAAAQTLHRYGLSGTFYITTSCIEWEEPFWPSEIRALIARLPGPAFWLRLGGRAVRIACPPDAREQAVTAVSRLFKSHEIPVRESLRAQLRSLAGGSVRTPMLTWRQLAAMRDLGMTIGAHTMTHPNLPSAGLAAATLEIVGSKKRLEDRLGGEVTMFSYPNGGAERYYTPELQQVVREAGFQAAATSRNGFVGPTSDVYALERVQVSERLEDLIFTLEADRLLFADRGPRRGTPQCGSHVERPTRTDRS